MNKEIWKNIFETFVKDFDAIDMAEIENIIDMMIVDRIDTEIFTSNLMVLAEGDMLFPGMNEHASLSIYNSEHPHILAFPSTRRPLGFPLWFYAAYPCYEMVFNNTKRN